MPTKRKRTTTRSKAMRKQPRRRPDVFVVERGANREADWTPLPPDEQSRFPKYVHVLGGDYDAKARYHPDSIRVGLTEGDPDNVSVHFTIYCDGAGDNTPEEAFEALVYAEDVREIHTALTAAIEQAEKLGILPPAKAVKRELRVGSFEYTGERGAGGKWTGKKMKPRAKNLSGGGK